MRKALLCVMIIVFLMGFCEKGFCHGYELPNPLEYNQASCFKEEGLIVDSSAYFGATLRFPFTFFGFILGTVVVGPIAYVLDGFDSEGYFAGVLFTPIACGIGGNYLGQYTIAGPVLCIKKVVWDFPILIYHKIKK